MTTSTICTTNEWTKLRNKVISKAVLICKNDERCEDAYAESALIRGIVREVLMEKFPSKLNLLPKDENHQADAIYLLGQDIEKELGYW
jgi:hypothetical protein